MLIITPAELSVAPRLACCAQVFDVAAVRAALEQRLKSLELELHQARRSGQGGDVVWHCTGKHGGCRHC